MDFTFNREDAAPDYNLGSGYTGELGSNLPDFSFGSSNYGSSFASENPYTSQYGFLGDMQSKPEESSFFGGLAKDLGKELFTGKNILGLISSFAGSSASGDALKLSKEQNEAAFQQQLSLLNAKGQLEKELLAMKIAAGGGGGGGGGGASVDKQIAAQKALARYNGMLQAQQNSSNSRLGGSSNIIAAIKAMQDGMQRPLVR